MNKVELLGYYGSDEVIACSAWTSTSRELIIVKKNNYNNLINCPINNIITYYVMFRIKL
jgi:hypothetical protein